MKTLLCHLMLSCLAHGPGAASVDDLTYGTVLYEYFQDDFEAGLVEALVAETRDRRGDDLLRFELAEGSFAFSDGMYEYARGVFDSIDGDALTDIDRMRLAFHLAREYHRRQEWPAVDEQIRTIDLGRNWFGRKRLHPEVEYMRAELAIVEGRFDEARTILGKLEDDERFRAYGLFNLGIALRAAGDFAAAHKTFETLSNVKIDPDDEEAADANEEIEDLVQRAKLAMAYINREQSALADAEVILSELPAKGRYRDLALATYGGLAMQQENHLLAARIWLTLQNQAYWTPSTATARIGYPVSLEAMSSGELALTHYMAAERAFETRLDRLVNLSQQAEDPAWMRDLLHVFSAHDPHLRDATFETPADDPRLGGIVERWREELGHTDWLEWLSTEDVHQLLVQWRTLTDMSGWLSELPPELDAYQEVATEQRRRSVLARDMIEGEDITRRRAMAQAQLARATGRLSSLLRENPRRESDWMLALAHDQEALILDSLASMRETVRAGVEPDRQKSWLDRLDRIEGMVFWTLVEDAPGRIRALNRSLSEAEALAVENADKLTRIQSAERNFAVGVQADFDSFRRRAGDLMVAVNDALGLREEMLAQQIRRGMRREMEQVQQYLLITRIAIARATDQLAAVGDVGPESTLEEPEELLP